MKSDNIEHSPGAYRPPKDGNATPDALLAPPCTPRGHGSRGRSRLARRLFQPFQTFIFGLLDYGRCAWRADETPDLSQTMSAVDNALQRAERFAGWLGGAEVPSPPPPEQVSVSEILQGEPPEPESPPPPASGPEARPTSLPPEPLA
jgi:hypothetical protein